MKGHPSRFAVLACWLVAAFSIWLSSPYDSNTQVDLVAVPVTSLLSNTMVWNVPLRRWFPEGHFSVAFILFAAIAAGVVTRLTGFIRQHVHPVLAAFVLFGLCLSLQPEQLIAVTIPLLALNVFDLCKNRSNFIGLALASVFAIIALITTLEFAIPVFFCGALLIGSPNWKNMRLSTINAVLFATGCIAFLYFWPSATLVALRPVGCLTWYDSLRASSVPFLLFSGIVPNLKAIILSLLILEIVRRQILHNGLSANTVICCFLATIGLCSSRLEAICIASMSLILVSGLRNKPSESSETASATNLTQKTIQHNTYLVPALVMLATVTIYGATSWSGEFSGSGSRSTSIVNVLQWNSSGPVMLTNLAQTHDWTAPKITQQFPLLMDDRWDAYSNACAIEYQNVCHDLKNGKSERYRTALGLTGGALPFIRANAVTLLVIESSDLSTIRQTSVDRHWRIMSIDRHRTIFGNVDVPSTEYQARRAIELFYHLEWPKTRFSGTLEGTTSLNSVKDRVAVASVLNSIRLPYAALKILQHDIDSRSKSVRVLSYVELAHRALRQTGRPSLLDHPRALRGLNDDTPQATFDSGIHQNLASEALKRDDLVSMELSEPADEIEVREAVRNGDFQLAKQILESFNSPDVKQFFECFLLDDSPNEILNRLQQILSGNLPTRLRAEALFYAGCLHLETGDADMARNSFIESASLAPQSPLTQLRSLYLNQLLR